MAAAGENQFSIDESTLSGPIQLLVRWNPLGSFSSTLAAGAVIPVNNSFKSLVLTLDTCDLLSNSFSVRNAMSYNPELSYNVPARYFNSIRQNVSNFVENGGGVQQVSLTSCPAGMLNCIILSLQPLSQINSPDAPGAAKSTYNPLFGSVDLETLQLDYGGTSLYRADSKAEIESNYRACFNGDTMTYDQIVSHFDVAAGAIAQLDKMTSSVIVIPLMYDGCKTLRGHLIENQPSYSGATLQLSFSVSNPNRKAISGLATEEHFLKAGVVGTNAVDPGADAVAWALDVTYCLSSILEINSGAIDLQL